MSFLKKLRLSRPEDQRLLDEALALLDLLASQIRVQEARIKAANIADADTALIASMPGTGPSFRLTKGLKKPPRREVSSFSTDPA